MSEHGAPVASRYGIRRSAEWRSVERAHLAASPSCIACRRPGARVEVHHVFPFHFCVRLGRPDLELDHRNLVTLCAESAERGGGNHHLLIGHFDDYESMNLDARDQALRRFHGMTANQLQACLAWREMAEGRPPHLADMTEPERRALRATMDKRLPLRRRSPDQTV